MLFPVTTLRRFILVQRRYDRRKEPDSCRRRVVGNIPADLVLLFLMTSSTACVKPPLPTSLSTSSLVLPVSARFVLARLSCIGPSGEMGDPFGAQELTCLFSTAL